MKDDRDNEQSVSHRNAGLSGWRLAIGVFLLLAGLSHAQAQIGSDRYSSIVIDARTGRELSAVNADEPRYPASLTKMMTLYMVFEALRDRRVSLGQLVPVSEHASAQTPSKLGLMPGTRITVEQCILALVTKSANDAAAALGELLGKDEARFAQIMTVRARALGMQHSVFRNASGLPDPDQITTARDMATLGRRLVIDFPSEYHYFATPSFRFRNRVIANHDHLLETYPGADGLKTGFITASGYNLVTSALRSEVRLVGVVLGAARAGERDGHMQQLLDAGFEKMDVPQIASAARKNAPQRPSVIPLPPPATGSLLTAGNPVQKMSSKWSVQVGAFSAEATARQAAAQARKLAEVGQVHVEPSTIKGRTNWRAQLVGMSAAEASGTCAVLLRRKMTCVLLKPELRQVARNF
jgi:D-alanyl-D-alanine carboxypeptidase